MRIVQLLPELREGGVERGVVELSRELVRAGHESVVISAGGTLADQIVAHGGQHVTLDIASKNPVTVPWRVAQLGRAFDRLQPTIIHARSRVPAWLAFLANRRRRIPFVTTVHGFNSVSPYSRVMTFGDRVICVSTAIKEYIQCHYGVADEKIAVIPRGVDLAYFNPDNLDHGFMADFSRRFRLEGRHVVTSVGRITQLKDYETFIRAIGTLKAQLPDIVGLIVGGVREDKQGYFASLQRLVESQGLQQEIVFTGSQARVAEIYALSNVVVSSSKKPESFGRSAAEALAMEVPVVATGHGGILDVVIEGKTGYLFAPGDAHGLADKVLAALNQPWPDLRAFVLSNFTLEQMVEKTLAVYEDVVSA